MGRALGTIPGAAGKAGSAIQAMGAVSLSLRGVYDGINSLKTVCSELTGAYQTQEENEIKLETIMRQRMGATDEMINSIKDLASAQQKQGVVGDEVQLAGAQQVATFLSQKESIEALLPAMNNLAVQRKGLNVTAEDMVNIGNLVGKVMQGNVGALTRVGITFTEAEKKAIKYGNEQERAAALAKVITNNVGNMNAELANTDAGKMKQASNEIGGLQVKMGQFFSQYQTFIMAFGQIGMAVSGIASITAGMRALSSAIGLTTLATKGLQVAQASFAAMSSLINAAINGTTLSLTALRAGIRGTITSLGLIGIAYIAISEAVSALIETFDSLTESTDDANARMSVTERLNNAVKTASDEVSSSVSEEKNRISSLTEIIQSNTSTLADKEAAIKQLKSIIPGFNATIDSEGRAHINAANAVEEHIKALDRLQRAIAAYKVGQDLQNDLAKADLDYFNARYPMRMQYKPSDSPTGS